MPKPQNCGDLVCLLDAQLRVRHASDTWIGFIGNSAHALVGTLFLALVHPEDRDHFSNWLQQVRSGTNQGISLRLRNSKGDWADFEVTGIAMPALPDCTLVICRDATERDRTEAEMLKLAAFAQFNPNPVLEMVPDGTLSYANEAAWKMARSLSQENPAGILPLNASGIVKMSLSTGQSRLHVRRRIGTRTLEWSFFPVTGQKVVHCYAEDITQSLNLEGQVRQMQKMESVGQLAAGIAHDFNNVLTVIQGHAGLLMAENLQGQLAESVRQISLAGERAAKLTRQLLAFSRKQVMQPQLVDLNQIVADIAKMLRTLLGERISLRQDLAASLPPVFADPGMVEQVLLNLAANARDAMLDGGQLLVQTKTVEVDEAYVEQHPQARAGLFVCLSVRDTGTGMDTQTLTRIFEPFFTTKEEGKGTGLGLATVYGIVQQHKGWMEVQSRIGQGSTFEIFLPASSKAASRDEASKTKKASGGTETILVVEDEESLREVMQEMLQKKGYTVYPAANGQQALEMWRRHGKQIDLLLTDLMIPQGLSGADLAAHALTEKPGLKVLYTSGYNPETVHPSFAPREGVNFLQKPYHPEMLAEVVRNCLDQAQT